MSKVTFITGNQGKADFLAKHIGYPVDHRKIELDEIQSLDLAEIVEHKARQAYEKIKSPVLVEDIGASLDAMDGLPGPFIKWFESALGLAGICELADKLGDRSAEVKICFGYFDGHDMKLFKGQVRGQIPAQPIGESGFGFDPIFIPEGHDKTYAQMNEGEREKYSVRSSQIYPAIKEFLESLNR